MKSVFRIAYWEHPKHNVPLAEDCEATFIVLILLDLDELFKASIGHAVLKFCMHFKV
jgi:hypothetical protein